MIVSFHSLFQYGFLQVVAVRITYHSFLWNMVESLKPGGHRVDTHPPPWAGDLAACMWVARSPPPAAFPAAGRPLDLYPAPSVV